MHTMNFIVIEGLKDMHAYIISIPNVVRYVRSNPSRFDNFKATIVREKLDSKALVF